MNAAFPGPFRRIAEPAAVAIALATIYLLLEPLSADHAAQQFRAGLFDLEGPGTWNNLWFAGHHVPGYSVIFPPLGALLGTRLVGALAAIAAALLFAAIADRAYGERARLGIAWFAAGTSISLFTGRLTFALGCAFALAAVFALQRGYRRTGLVIAVVTPLASPVAALFLAAGGFAYWLAERRRLGIELAIAAFGAAVVLTKLFPEGGSEPFDASSFMPAALVATAAYFAIPKQERLLRAGVAVYGAVLLASFVVANPLGGNATRMGALLIGPLLACALWRREGNDRWLLLLLAPFLVYWQWSPVVRDLEAIHAEPSVEASYYAPISAFLSTETRGNPARVEIVPTENHWEAAIVPPADIPIARGWERQLDRKLNPLFYGNDTHPLTPGRYRRWLDRLAVRYVALSNGPLDYAGVDEAKVIHGRPSYLRPVFHSADWTVYEVKHAVPLAALPAHMVSLEPDRFTLYSATAATSIVRIRYSPYFQLATGVGCVEESPNGFTEVHFARPGIAEVVTKFSPLRIFEHGPRCRTGS
jgi:hypothetical protein